MGLGVNVAVAALAVCIFREAHFVPSHLLPEELIPYSPHLGLVLLDNLFLTQQLPFFVLFLILGYLVLIRDYLIPHLPVGLLFLIHPSVYRLKRIRKNLARVPRILQRELVDLQELHFVNRTLFGKPDGVGAHVLHHRRQML